MVISGYLRDRMDYIIRVEKVRSKQSISFDCTGRDPCRNFRIFMRNTYGLVPSRCMSRAAATRQLLRDVQIEVKTKRRLEFLACFFDVCFD